MLQKLRTGPGFRVAIVIAAFAALCLVAPPAVMAFGHGNNTMHCLANADTVDHGCTEGPRERIKAITGSSGGPKPLAAAASIA